MRDWGGELSISTAEKITEILDYVLQHRCTVVCIIKDIYHVEVWAEVVARKENGKLAHLQYLETGEPIILWSIADHAWYISPMDQPEVKVSWWDGMLTIRHNAPAGHPLVWIFKPMLESGCKGLSIWRLLFDSILYSLRSLIGLNLSSDNGRP